MRGFEVTSALSEPLFTNELAELGIDVYRPSEDQLKEKEPDES